jgi:hypothetical protein
VWLKHPHWIPVAWLLSLINAGAVWFAARPGEPWHALSHALLAVGLAAGAQHLRHRRRLTPSGNLQRALAENERLQQVSDEGTNTG